jgi:hypothetical protein
MDITKMLYTLKKTIDFEEKIITDWPDQTDSDF